MMRIPLDRPVSDLFLGLYCGWPCWFGDVMCVDMTVKEFGESVHNRFM